MMKRLLFLLLVLFGVLNFSYAQERHELENMRVKIQSDEFNKSRKIEKKKSGVRDYIYGDPLAYALSKTKPLGKLIAPSAEYLIKTKLAGGTYEVTIGYRALKSDKFTGDPEIILGFDELPTKEISLDYSKNVKKKKVDFKVNFLRGKNHKLKLYLTTPNVEIDYIEVRKKLINK